MRLFTLIGYKCFFWRILLEAITGILRKTYLHFTIKFGEKSVIPKLKSLASQL